jgi:hypothetical protein
MAMFHHDWVKTPGHVRDSRLRTVATSGDDGSGVPIPLHNYIVEFRAPNGELARLEVEQHVDTVSVPVGSELPLLVRPDGKKAVIDHKDPSVNVNAVYKADRKADKERFRGQLEGH